MAAAIAAAGQGDRRLSERVHGTRRCCKRLRALLNLMLPGDECSFQREIRTVREAARRLAGLRDADALIKCHDRLVMGFEHPNTCPCLSSLRRTLCARRDQLLGTEEGAGPGGELADFAGMIRSMHDRAADWYPWVPNMDAVVDAFACSYDNARDRMRRAIADPMPENLHEWRKRAKEHAFQALLIPDLGAFHADEWHAFAAELGEVLGNANDLHGYVSLLDGDEHLDLARQERRALAALARRRIAECRRRAETLGRLVFAAPSTRVMGRAQRWLKVAEPAHGGCRHACRVTPYNPLETAAIDGLDGFRRGSSVPVELVGDAPFGHRTPS